ncbi:hypothetical protein Arub01_01850 [Actinomadura rubrobrunea]|uniref:Uncharacterized protein n=1 Tax=Actinomadura rubrobrunea TaxID=115335 RepID=A0A9W6PRZ8_9ACTN|nr:hypothetical protein [Actinomadura rubrobrunea]GLW61941.1 hypothetical protein Arub01_01850 [Actinomadura rubrobrunea]
MTGWDETSLARLRAAAYRWDGEAGVEALRSRPLGRVLQYAGDVLIAALEQGVPGAEALSRKCLEELDGRGLPGDAELADRLSAALGAPRGPELAEAPVDLGALAAALDDDAPYAVDLRTGDVLPAEEAGPSFTESLEYEPERWLALWGEPGGDRGEEARRGRARRWLAERGYRPGPRTL